MASQNIHNICIFIVTLTARMSLEAPFEVSGVKEIKDSTSATPFIVVRMRNEKDGREKFLLKAGDGVSWEVVVLVVMVLVNVLLSEILSVSLCWGRLSGGGGQDQTFSSRQENYHLQQVRRTFIYYVFNSKINYFLFFSPGPSHKLTFSILKSNFPDYNSIMWRDG